jgi:hypothetical protein
VPARLDDAEPSRLRSATVVAIFVTVALLAARAASLRAEWAINLCVKRVF